MALTGPRSSDVAHLRDGRAVLKSGKQHHRLSTRTANRALAQALAEKHHIAVLEGRAGLRQAKPVLLSVHITAYVAHTAKTNRSSYKDQAVLDRLRDSMGDRSIAEISAFHIERWKRERADIVSRSTVNRELNIVRGCFSRAVDWGHLSASPLRTVRSYRVDDARLRVCSPEEIKTILDAATGDLRLLARLTLESLPRLSEALNLRRDDIGPASITIVRSKSGKARRVPVTPELRADLLTRCHAKGFIFGVGNERQPPQAAAISVAFARLASSLGLNGIAHHTFRHTGATVMVANGVSLRAVQVIGDGLRCGWSSAMRTSMTRNFSAPFASHAHVDAAVKAPTKTPRGEKTAQATPNGSNSAKS